MIMNSHQVSYKKKVGSGIGWEAKHKKTHEHMKVVHVGTKKMFVPVNDGKKSEMPIEHELKNMMIMPNIGGSGLVTPGSGLGMAHKKLSKIHDKKLKAAIHAILK
jgi:tRNA A37 threonylcarbamoyladenosine dehydratase